MLTPDPHNSLTACSCCAQELGANDRAVTYDSVRKLLICSTCVGRFLPVLLLDIQTGVDRWGPEGWLPDGLKLTQAANRAERLAKTLRNWEECCGSNA